MDFVDNENILVLEKNLGTIRLISSSNHSLQEDLVLAMVVDNEAERSFGNTILASQQLLVTGHFGMRSHNMWF